jgi:hypothetical protein
MATIGIASIADNPIVKRVLFIIGTSTASPTGGRARQTVKKG